MILAAEKSNIISENRRSPIDRIKRRAIVQTIPYLCLRDESVQAEENFLEKKLLEAAMQSKLLDPWLAFNFRVLLQLGTHHVKKVWCLFSTTCPRPPPSLPGMVQEALCMTDHHVTWPCQLPKKRRVQNRRLLTFLLTSSRSFHFIHIFCTTTSYLRSSDKAMQILSTKTKR